MIIRAIFIVISAVGVGLLSGCEYDQRKATDDKARIFVFTKTSGFRHASIDKGVETIKHLSSDDGIEFVHSEDSENFKDEILSGFDAIVFLNTTGDILDQEQQVALERYIQAGGGFVGVHAASDTEVVKEPGGSYWPWYQRLVGGAFAGHPDDSDQEATVTVRNSQHPATASLPKNWTASDEWYDFKRMSEGINVLLTVDENTYEGASMEKGEYHPVAWYREFDGGRSFYTALGHADEIYDDDNFRALLRGGIKYAMGDREELNYALSRPEPWRFTRKILDSGLNEPLKLAFSPEGSLYFIERKGALKRYNFETGSSELVHTFSNTNTTNEYGLLGLAFDPNFDKNRWLYIYRTVGKTGSSRHVLARYKLIGSTVDESTGQILLEMPAEATKDKLASHTGGDMEFDKAGNLWLSTGDDTEADEYPYLDDRPGKHYRDAARTAGNSQDLRGKILRITPTEEVNDSGLYYKIPEGNLFDSPSEGRPEIYVMGVRNPYTIAFDDRRSVLYWGDIGPDANENSERGPLGYDEFNRTNQPGNFGWPYVIADNQPYSYYSYENGSVLGDVNVSAPRNRSSNNTGLDVLPPAKPAWIFYPYKESGDFFELGSGGRNALVSSVYYSDEADQDSEISFPSYFDGKLIISDFVRKWLMVVGVDDEGEFEAISPIINEPLSAPLDMAFGPDGALYIVEYGNGWFMQNPDSHISRIEYYSGENVPPVASASASKKYGDSPLSVDFDASGSYDRDGNEHDMEYTWSVIGSSGEEREIGRGKNVQHIFRKDGSYRVMLTVTDDHGDSDIATLTINVGNESPEVSIEGLSNQSFYWSGKSESYEIIVTDPEDGGSKSGDISPSSVDIIEKFVSSDEELQQALMSLEEDQEDEGKALALGEGGSCRACHSASERSVGPSFTAVANRYAGADDGSATIRRSIVEGVSGKWGSNHAMPANPGLSQKELDRIVTFILSLSDNGDTKAQTGGFSGSITFDKSPERSDMSTPNEGGQVSPGESVGGMYVIGASYKDNGAGEAPPIRATKVVVLRSPTFSVPDFVERSGIRLVETSNGAKLALVEWPDDGGTFHYIRISDVDLSGVSEIQVVGGAVEGMMPGGILELRVDGAEVAPTSFMTIKPSKNPFSTAGSFDVSDLEGFHDLYIGAPAQEGEPGALFMIGKIQFVQ